jgi:hypothetical protein
VEPKLLQNLYNRKKQVWNVLAPPFSKGGKGGKN